MFMLAEKEQLDAVLYSQVAQLNNQRGCAPPLAYKKNNNNEKRWFLNLICNAPLWSITVEDNIDVDIMQGVFFYFFSQFNRL